MHRLQSLAALAFIAAGVGPTPAQANMVVGNAILIQQDVEGAFNDQDWTQTSKGDDVFEAEFIRTQVNSRANFALFDGSTIGLGATAIMKIDHVVLDPRNHSIQKLIVSAKEGAVRWISGNSMSGAYQIDTPHAVITDEGTAFDLVVEQQRTLVLLHTGRVTVCAKGAPGRCKTLSRRGEMVLATTDDVVGPWESGLEPSGFETQCLNAKCTIAAFALPPPQPPSDGGRNGPGRLPEPRHAVVPSRPEMGETVVPSEPERGDTPVPVGTPTREVAVPSGPPIPEVLGGLGLWLYTHPGHGGQHGTPPPPGPQYPPPPGTPYPPPRGTTGATPTGTTTTDTKPTGTKPTGTTTTDTRTTGTRTTDTKPTGTTTTDTKPTGTKPTGTTTTGTTTTGTRYQGPAIVRTPTDTKYPASSEPGRNVTKYSAPANDTIVAKRPGPPNLMMHSGPPNLTMRSGLLNLMMRSGPPNLMMHPGPPQLHLPGGPFRRFGPPR
jgi:hypothetical protein